MTSFISLSTSSSSGFGLRSFTSTDHELGVKSSKREKKEKGLSSFISLSSASSTTDSKNEYGNGMKRFEKERKEFSNGKKWFSHLISPFVKQVDTDEEKVEIPDDWSRGRFWRGV